MNEPNKWRVAHLAGDTKSYDDFVAAFERAYEENGKPEGMAMFSHNDSFGILMAVSITPESAVYCPFSLSWDEWSKVPLDFGHTGWVAGDVNLKHDASSFPPTH